MACTIQYLNAMGKSLGTRPISAILFTGALKLKLSLRSNWGSRLKVRHEAVVAVALLPLKCYGIIGVACQASRIQHAKLCASQMLPSETSLTTTKGLEALEHSFSLVVNIDTAIHLHQEKIVRLAAIILIKVDIWREGV